MKKLLQRLEIKRKTAGFMAAIFAIMAFLPYFQKIWSPLQNMHSLLKPFHYPHGRLADTMKIISKAIYQQD